MRAIIVFFNCFIGVLVTKQLSANEVSPNNHVPFILSKEIVDEKGHKRESNFIARGIDGRVLINRKEFGADDKKGVSSTIVQTKDGKFVFGQEDLQSKKEKRSFDMLVRDVLAQLENVKTKRQSGFLGRGPLGQFLVGRDADDKNNEVSKRQSGFLGRGPSGQFLVGRDADDKNNEASKRQSGFLGRGPLGQFLVGRDTDDKNNEASKRQSGFLGRGPSGQFLFGRENEKKTQKSTEKKEKS